jgi:hypothetical protein
MLNSLLYTKLVTNRQQSDQGCFSKEKIKKSTTLETLKKILNIAPKTSTIESMLASLKKALWLPTAYIRWETFE